MKSDSKIADNPPVSGSGKVLGNEAYMGEGREQIGKLRKRYGDLLEAAPDAMIFVERGGRIVLANSQAEKLFGYSQGELMGGDLHMLIPEQFRSRHKDKFLRYFAEPGMRPMGSGIKIYGRKNDGTEFSADISLSPLKSDGETFVTAAVRDITERVKAEDQIEFDYQIQRAINTLLKIAHEPTSLDEQLAHGLDLILSISQLALQSIGSIYLVDETSESLVLKAQRGLSDIQADTCAELPMGHKPDTGAAENCEIAFTECINTPREILEADGPHVGYCIPISDGEKAFGLINVFAKKGHREDPQGKAFLSAVSKTLAFVIQRYRIEAEKHKLLEQLAQSEKLAALGRITANIAHEIRNPLTVVGGFARRLQKMAADEAMKREYVEFIVSEVGQLEVVLKSILNFAREAALELERHYIHEIVDEVVKVYAPSCLERSITIQKSYDYTSEIAVDKNRVREVIVNLVSNALDAMADKGTLKVATAQKTVDGIPYVTVKISDTGEGIPPEKADKIFEPFYTTKISTRGVGLGLSICKKIMEDHEGFITVESTVGTGTAFTLYFPLDRKPRKSKNNS